MTTIPESTFESTEAMLVEFIAERVGTTRDSIDVSQPVFGVDGASVGPVVLDSMELVELIVCLEGQLGISLLDHFENFDELSIAAMAVIVHAALRHDTIGAHDEGPLVGGDRWT